MLPMRGWSLGTGYEWWHAHSGLGTRSRSQLSSAAHLWLRGSDRGRAQGSLGPRFVARVCDCPLPAPGTGPVLGVTRVLALAWSGHWLPPPAHQCQFRPELPNVNTRDPATPGHPSKSWAGKHYVWYFEFSFGGNYSGFWKAATLISFSEFMNIFSIIEGRQKTNYPCFRSRKISFLGYFTSFQDLGINENAWSLVALFSLFPGWFA